MTLVLAAAVVALLCAARLAGAELVPPTVTDPPFPGPTHEAEFHWWDVFTSRAAAYLVPAANKADNILDDARKGAAQAGDHLTRGAAQYGDRVADEAGNLAHRAKQDARYATKRVWQAGMAAQEEVDAQGKKAAHKAETTADSLNQYGQGFLHRIYATTRGAGSSLRADLKAGLEKLGNMVGTLGHGASPSWPETVFEGTKDPVFSKYIHDLGHASEQATAQLRSKLDVHTEILEKMIRSHLSGQLPLAGCYAPLLTLILLYLASTVWCRKAELRRRLQLQLNGTSSQGSGRSSAVQQEYMLALDKITGSCAYLMLVPVAITLLVIMELGGMAGWLISSSYTCLIAGTVAAAQPALLASLWPRDDAANIGQRLAIGTTVIAAVCCLAHSTFG
ncbi:hypothetical protein GGF46_005468 [Coemansia sp. RSA 552]|nr:hypothetical protein GGF46_005468 [Coemansia sp. RSA 552]